MIGTDYDVEKLISMNVKNQEIISKYKQAMKHSEAKKVNLRGPYIIKNSK